MIKKVNKGEIDCNNQALFFSKVIKGFLLSINEQLSIRGIPLPHMILHTGDDTMWMEAQGYDCSVEPCEIGESNIYSVKPRCIVNVGSIDMIPDQLTNPYTRGVMQLEYNDKLYTLNGEFRRMPVKISLDLKYILETFTDSLELMQHIVTKLVFIKTYKIEYLGQNILCSYKVPETLSDEHLAELSGDINDSKDHFINLSIELETNIPVFDNRTMVEHKIITNPVNKLSINEVVVDERSNRTRSGNKGFGGR